jgi:hypothetical protein
MTLEILCRGHIAQICGWCFGCKKDDYNRECPNYTPTILQTFDVEENQEIETAERNIQYLVRARAERGIRNAIRVGSTGGAY